MKDEQFLEAIRALAAKAVRTDAQIEGLRGVVTVLAGQVGLSIEDVNKMVDAGAEFAHDQILAAMEDNDPEFAAWLDKDRKP